MSNPLPNVSPPGPEEIDVSSTDASRKQRIPKVAKDFRDIMDRGKQNTVSEEENLKVKKKPVFIEEQGPPLPTGLPTPLAGMAGTQQSPASSGKKGLPLPAVGTVPLSTAPMPTVSEGTTDLSPQTIQQKSPFFAMPMGQVSQEPTQAPAQTSPFALYQNMSTKGTQANANGQQKWQEPVLFQEPQSDIAYFSPVNIAPPPTNLVSAPVPRGPDAIQQLREIIAQIVDKLYTIQTEGKTDTVITLSNPPLLAGAHVVVSSFNNATGQLNIQFENLTQAAKQFLDAPTIQNSLRTSLEDKGFVVQMLTTTTIIEGPNLPDSSGAASYDREREGQGGPGAQDQQQEDQQ